MHRETGCRKTAESGAGARVDTGNPGYSSVSFSFRRAPSNIAAYEFDDRFHGVNHKFLVDPEVNFFPFLAALQEFFDVLEFIVGKLERRTDRGFLC